MDVARDKQLRGVVSASVQDNQAMRRVFERCGLAVLAKLDVWPSRSLRRGPAPSQALEDLIPGFPDALYTPAAQQLLPAWRPCATVQQLQAALSSMSSSSSSPVGGSGGQAAPADISSSSGGGAPALTHWLPHVYCVYPVDWAPVEQWVAQGAVWLLPAGYVTEQGQGSCEQGGGQDAAAAAVLLVAPSAELQGQFAAGVCGRTSESIEAAALKAYTIDKNLRLFVHRLGGSSPSRLYDAIGGVSDFIVFSKAL